MFENMSALLAFGAIFMFCGLWNLDASEHWVSYKSISSEKLPLRHATTQYMISRYILTSKQDLRN